MSKFDAILKKIEEQTGTAVPAQPVGTGTAPQQTPQQQQQAIQQAAKLLNMDPKALEQILTAQQQAQQQKPVAGAAQQSTQPAV